MSHFTDMTPYLNSPPAPYYEQHTLSHRQYPNHATSSAFSSSANPDEDWTKISDLAERRRIQNRIAQRNYRKKLKRRLEDLERRAGTSDGTPPPVEIPPTTSRVSKSGQNKRSKPAALPSSSVQSLLQNSMSTRPMSSPPMLNDNLLFRSSLKDGQVTPPLPSHQHQQQQHQFFCDTYTSLQPTDIMPSYSMMPTTPNYQNTYLAPEAEQYIPDIKQQSYQSDETLLACGGLGGLMLTHSYDQLPSTPPLTEFDLPVDYDEYPATPKCHSLPNLPTP